MRTRFFLSLVYGSVAFVSSVSLFDFSTCIAVATEAVESTQDREALRSKLVNKGIEYLRKAQSEDGSYSSKSGLESQVRPS